jgi:hypothetical protein
MKHTKIIPPDLPDTGSEHAVTDWLNNSGVIRAGWNGQQWNVYLKGNRFATGATVEEAVASIGGEA